MEIVTVVSDVGTSAELVASSRSCIVSVRVVRDDALRLVGLAFTFLSRWSNRESHTRTKYLWGVRDGTPSRCRVGLNEVGEVVGG